MNFGLCTLSNKEMSVDSVMEIAADAGYDGVEVWGRDHIGDGSPETCREIVKQADNLGLEIPVYGSYLRPGTTTFPDEVEHELAVADRLGADKIRVWAGDQEYDDCEPSHWEQVIADLNYTAAQAKPHDVNVTVEKHANTVTDDSEGARKLIEAINHENVGLNWQPGFWLPPADLVTEAKALAPLSNNVHVQAVPEPKSRDRCALVNAYFALERLLEPFDDGSFDGYVNVEFVDSDIDYGTAVAGDLAYLQSITS